MLGRHMYFLYASSVSIKNVLQKKKKKGLCKCLLYETLFMPTTRLFFLTLKIAFINKYCNN